MASDDIQLRLNGLMSVTGPAVELQRFGGNYYGGGSTATIVDNWHRHEEFGPLKENDLIEISTAGFVTDPLQQRLVWKGRITKVAPGGLSREGTTWELRGCEYLLNRHVHLWNGSSVRTYNHNFQTQPNSPGFLTGASPGTGSIDVTARWSVGQILLDVLEHAFGIDESSRKTVGGGYANMPLASAIPMHHRWVTSPYAASYPAGLARDYVDQLVWDPDEILSALNIYQPNMSFQGDRLWDLIESLVQMGGNHGVFIDPTQHARPRLVIWQYKNSVTVEKKMGRLNVSAESSEYSVIDDDWESDTTNVRNIITIEGHPRHNVTDPTLPAADPRSGKLVQMDAAGLVWQIDNELVRDFVVGWSTSNQSTSIRGVPAAENSSYGPVLYDGSSPKATHAGRDITPTFLNGMMFSTVTLSGDLRVKTYYMEPHTVTVGPGPGQCGQRPATGLGSSPRYPTPSPLDAYTNSGIRQAMVVPMYDFVHPSSQTDQAYSGVVSQPEKNFGRNDGKLTHGLMTSAGMEQARLPAITESPTVRDDTWAMVILAEEYQRRFRDIRVRCRLTIDQVKLAGMFERVTADPLTGLLITTDPISGLTGSPSTEPGLCKQVFMNAGTTPRLATSPLAFPWPPNTTPLQVFGGGQNRFMFALQVMGYEVVVHGGPTGSDRIILELSNDVYNVNWRQPQVWLRRETEKQMRAIARETKENMMVGTRPGARSAGEVQVHNNESKLQAYPAQLPRMNVFGDPTRIPQL